jgi:hypothetical protein
MGSDGGDRVKFLMNQTNWQCRCTSRPGENCCANLFSALYCHNIWAKMTSDGLSGWVERDLSLYINGKAGVDDLALGRDKAGNVVLIVSERARDSMTTDQFELKELIDFAPDYLVARA